MKKGCFYGLGCVAAIATSWIWIPAFLFGLYFLLELASRLLGAI